MMSDKIRTWDISGDDLNGVAPPPASPELLSRIQSNIPRGVIEMKAWSENLAAVGIDSSKLEGVSDEVILAAFPDESR
ncbi:MAG: hypothetical protein JWM81_1061 [Candidatus Saccharibacteria bacterium]|nr:hypothetical protein [Candidatus Saccharibacteria bacterium]